MIRYMVTKKQLFSHGAVQISHHNIEFLWQREVIIKHLITFLSVYHSTSVLWHIKPKTKVLHKPDGTVTEDDKRVEISDLGSRGIVLSM